VLLDRAAEGEAEHGRRDERDGEIAPQRGIHGEEAPAVLPDDRKHRPGLDGDVEDLGLLAVEAEQVAREDQVSGARDRQELGQPLDDAKDEGLEQ